MKIFVYLSGFSDSFSPGYFLIAVLMDMHIIVLYGYFNLISIVWMECFHLMLIVLKLYFIIFNFIKLSSGNDEGRNVLFVNKWIKSTL